ncbi:MAG: hypothetical protein JHC93_03640 [Parachlamydiales bacterium]|nr:hypothetical protein [Parachlamydiales bacterium]
MGNVSSSYSSSGTINSGHLYRPTTVARVGFHLKNVIFSCGPNQVISAIAIPVLVTKKICHSKLVGRLIYRDFDLINNSMGSNNYNGCGTFSCYIIKAVPVLGEDLHIKLHTVGT